MLHPDPAGSRRLASPNGETGKPAWSVQTLDANDAFLGRDMEPPRESRPGANHGQLQRPAGRDHAAAAHVLGERGQGQRLRDLWLSHIGAAPMAPGELASLGELVDRRPDGQAGDAQILAELALGWDGLAHQERLDQIKHPLAGLVLLPQLPLRTSVVL